MATLLCQFTSARLALLPARNGEQNAYSTPPPPRERLAQTARPPATRHRCTLGVQGSEGERCLTTGCHRPPGLVGTIVPDEVITQRQQGAPLMAFRAPQVVASSQGIVEADQGAEVKRPAVRWPYRLDSALGMAGSMQDVLLA
jgi:hypothetical protein